MSTTQPKVYLISGASRGIGYALIEQISQRPNHIVYAAARDPANAAALNKLAESRSGAIKVVKLVAGSEEDAKAIMEQVRSAEGHLDVVLAVSGVALWQHYAPVKDCTNESIMEHFNTNLIGTVSLYRNVYPLLKAAPRGAIFMPMSSTMASITKAGEYAFPLCGLSMSKASINMLVRNIHLESEKEGFVVFPMDPGWVSGQPSEGRHR